MLRRKRKKAGVDKIEEFSKEFAYDSVLPSYDFMHSLFDQVPMIDYQT